MYIPNQFKKKSGHFFIIGFTTGTIVAYMLFTFMYGKMYEQLLETNLSLKTTVTELTEQNEALLQDKAHLNEKQKSDVTVHSIDITFLNPTELKLDRLMLHQFNDILLREISHIIGQDIVTLSENDRLLISTLENKLITLTESTYSFEVTRLTIAKNVKITLNVKLA